MSQLKYIARLDCLSWWLQQQLLAIWLVSRRFGVLYNSFSCAHYGRTSSLLLLSPFISLRLCLRSFFDYHEVIFPHIFIGFLAMKLRPNSAYFWWEFSWWQRKERILPFLSFLSSFLIFHIAIWYSELVSNLTNGLVSLIFRTVKSFYYWRVQKL